MKMHTTNSSRCRTGCVGVCLRSKTRMGRNGPRTRFYFQATVRNAHGCKRWLMFPIDTLGRKEAFRRAVRARAQYETAVRIQRTEGEGGMTAKEAFGNVKLIAGRAE
jgi:hypothetical protein